MSKSKKKWGGVGLLALAAGAVQAAGGHHDVDDANILARGECAQETWLFAFDGGGRRLHVGASCRVGPVELGLAAEHSRGSNEAAATFWAPEVKWVHEVADDFRIGFDVQPIFQTNARPHYAGLSAYAIASWSPRPDLSLHANYGRDFGHGSPDEPRGGVAAEWTPVQRWSFVAERYREQGSHAFRLGTRWAGGDGWSVDLSRARRLAGPRPSNWTLGLNLDFGGN